MSQRADADASDEELVARAVRADRDALEVLLSRHVDRVHAVCRRILRDPDDAQDATQEALVAIARGLAGFDHRARFSTWLYRVATNAALDEARRRGRRPAPTEAALTAPDPAPGIDTAVAERLDVDAALAGLPPEFRAAVALRDLADLDYATIAEVLGIPPGTVRSRIARGRAALAGRLGNPEPVPERPSEYP
jgi:RNA polymerase sigma-70 factor (ECF subfamily)